MKTDQKLKILVAPLFWGIGHATRCVPIIKSLIQNGFEPIIASDGFALKFLQKEFPKLKMYKLPSYNVTYTKNGKLLKLRLLFQTAKILKVIKKEHQIVQEIIKKERITGIISDNRFGVYSANIPSVYITHQIQVLSGLTTFLTSKLHQKQIQKFNEVWIPDLEQKPRLAGKLSITKSNLKYKYIGVLSRFKKENIPILKVKQAILVLLSGVEPQRTLLENKLIKEFKNYPNKILFVRGVLPNAPKLINTKNSTFINFLAQNKLQKAICQSNLIIARSGYSTIMDLAVLQKKAFFIPTSGQTEQEYLAKNLQNLKIAPFSTQKEFTLKQLNKVIDYTGFIENMETQNKFPFTIFQ